MRIHKVHVKNFRALRDTELSLNDTTALIGENNAGKSAFLIAIDLFFQAAPQLSQNDYSDGNFSEPIEITIYFCDLTPHDRKEFESNLVGDHFILTRRFRYGNAGDSGQFFVSARVNPEFTDCRSESGKTPKMALYNKLREKFSVLPKVKSADEIEPSLENWESANPDSLQLHKVGSFKGWTNVAVGKLKAKTEYIFVRASHDAAVELQTNKKSPVKELINTIARQTIENNSKFKEVLEAANKEIQELTDPSKVPALADIGMNLTKILNDYYKDSEIITTWKPIDSIQPSFPASEIAVKDKDFTTNIDGVGHGLQRAIMLTTLQYMARRRVSVEPNEAKFAEPQSDIIIAIEEPEIYQHPIKQRLFAKVLQSLGEDFSQITGIRIQTIYVTHSPLLVSLAKCQDIRVIRYRPSVTKNVTVSKTSLQSCAQKLAEIDSAGTATVMSDQKLAAKLHTFKGEIAEGFFADCVVLVEGAGDKAILDAYYKSIGRDPHADGIVIAEVGGKNNLAKTIVVFDQLGIPCYWIFDNDKSGKKKDIKNKNKELQRLAEISADKCVEYPVGPNSRFAAWEEKIEKYVIDTAGPAFAESVKALTDEFDDTEADDWLKTPSPANALIKLLREKGIIFNELQMIVVFIDALRSESLDAK